MERLSFGPESRYDALEAAIHVARYTLVRPLCAGRSVLDLACGEGYGTALLADWGAREAIGVDVSPEAIERAGALFARPGVGFLLRGADAADDGLGDRRFDLVVSLETIEHVPDAAAFLRELRDRVAPGGTLVVSCPNDWWYFPRAEESNPFHHRKYTLDEFRELAHGALGPADAWYLGAGASGYCNVALGRIPALTGDAPQDRMLDARALQASMLVPPAPGDAPDPGCASYFVAAWGPDAGRLESAALMPMGMDAFAAGLRRAEGTADADTARRLADLRAVEARLRALADEVTAPAVAAARREPLDPLAAARTALLADALARENAALRDRVAELEPTDQAPFASPDFVPRVDLEHAEVRLAQAEREQHRLLREVASLRQAYDAFGAVAVRAAVPVADSDATDTDGAPDERDARIAALQAELAKAEREQYELLREVASLRQAYDAFGAVAVRAAVPVADSDATDAAGAPDERDARIAALQAECDALRPAAARYVRLAGMMPASVRRVVMRAVRRARSA
jgi:SAM-dependent methyltransferase/NAD(P)H-dependent FMN reductase